MPKGPELSDPRSPSRRSWPLERVLFALAGTMSIIAAVLSVLVSKWFGLIAAFVGVNQWAYVAFGACPASILLRRTCNLRPASEAPGAIPTMTEAQVTVYWPSFNRHRVRGSGPRPSGRRWRRSDRSAGSAATPPRTSARS